MGAVVVRINPKSLRKIEFRILLNFLYHSACPAPHVGIPHTSYKTSLHPHHPTTTPHDAISARHAALTTASTHDIHAVRVKEGEGVVQERAGQRGAAAGREGARRGVRAAGEHPGAAAGDAHARRRGRRLRARPYAVRALRRARQVRARAPARGPAPPQDARVSACRPRAAGEGAERGEVVQEVLV